MSHYKPPFFLFNGHLETIFPALFRRIAPQPFQKEKIPTADNDVLELQWLRKESTKLVIIQHGLEGNANRPYVLGMAKAFYDKGFDALAWSYRGCGEEMNRQLRFYHSGATDDLHTVIEHALRKYGYQEICLIGFSLGGNMTLKYLGERDTLPQIKKAAVFSVPLDLESSCRKISIPSNRIYARRFLKSLKNKIMSKSALMPGLDTTKLGAIKSILEFDDAYTAPLHGFANAVEYYTACSSLYFLKDIKIPTLIVNTKNDPFLSPECYPVRALQDHPFVKIETPEKGGHVGFTLLSNKGLYWSEQRALEWMG